MMKKLRHTLTVLISAATVLLLASCQEVIFDTIRQEIKLEDAQITGTINSIVRYTMEATETTTTTAEDGTETTSTTNTNHEFLFCQNGNIWYRDVQTASTTTSHYSEQWSRIKQPDSNIIKLAADSEYLYALAAPTYADNEDTGDNIESGRSIYYAKVEKVADISAIEWKAIEFDGVTTFSTSVTSVIFCTNTPHKDNRRAFARIGSVVYELNKENEGTAKPIGTGETDHTTTPTTGVRSAAYLNGDVYFSSGYAMTSNETTTDEATYIYYNSGDDLYYRTAATDWVEAGDPGDVIYAMAYTNDYLLLGTDDGLIHVKVTEGVPAGSTSDFDTNAESTLSSYYQVRAIITVNPENAETETAAYGTTSFSGTSGSFSNSCLWGYYPKRGKWNCE